MRSFIAREALLFIVCGFEFGAHAQLFVETPPPLFPGGANTDYFGWSIDVDGDRMVVGAPKTDTLTIVDAGAVYVYQWANGVNEWLLDDMLSDPLALPGAEFGSVVAIGDERIAVSNRNGCGGGAWPCQVLVFDHTGSTWAVAGTLEIPDSVSGGEFGRALSMDGDQLAVGGAMAGDRECVLLYDLALGLSAYSVIEEDTAHAGSDDRFGYGLALDADALWITAHKDDDLGTDAGAAYVYGRASGDWSLVRKVLPSSGDAGDGFGTSVALSGGVAVVSALYGEVGSANSGVAYVFEADHGFPGNWGEVSELTPLDAQDGMQFGWSVDVAGDVIIIGAPKDDSGLGPVPEDGAVHVYGRDGDTWSGTQRLSASENIERLGHAVRLTANGLVAGAPWNNIASGSDGLIRVYRPSAVAIGSLPAPARMIISPNPAHDVAVIDLHNSRAGIRQIQLVDAFGRRITSYVLASDRLILQRGDVASGFYWVRLIGAQGEVISDTALIWD